MLPVVFSDLVGCGADLLVELAQFLLLLRSCQFECRRASVGIFTVVKEGKHSIVLVMADRIELMRVTLCAADGEAQPNNTCCIDAIDDFLDAKLLGICATFFIDQRIAMKAR